MRFWIDQHGCAKNQVDGEELAARLEASGHEYVESAEMADLIIVNTCGFIESAKKESLGAVMDLKAAWPDKKVLVAGCLSQRYPEELAAGLSEADGIFGNADLSLATAAAVATITGEHPVLAPPQPRGVTETRAFERVRLFDFPGTAHVKITEGCSNNCTYCAIPLIRGELRSRRIEDIAEECRVLIRRGIKELVLIGQDLGAFGSDLAGRTGTELPELLEALSALDGDFRVRVLYIHPDHFPERILEVMLRDPRILPYFDLPFQHASGTLLHTMNRRGNDAIYLDLIRRIRSALPDAMIRSTFLVGFPGETDDDFAVLRRFQEDAQLDWLGVFTYSREEGTVAYDMKHRVAKKLANARKNEIETAQTPITEARLARFVGREIRVLVEEKVEGEELALGRAWMQAPDVDGLVVLRGSHAPGDLVPARVLAVRGVDLDAVPTDEASRPGKARA
ncbi:MAG: 30S ribosomal protein S12 methylthiotransferase RimO [Rectinemataceae bacterium]